MYPIINILCATDDHYAPYCGIMLTSLFESNKEYRFNVFVFVNKDLSKTNNTKFNQLKSKYGNNINLMSIDDTIVESFPINLNHITIPTYYRLLAAELLPEEIDKVIYLDCDIIVVGDIKPLWEVNLEGRALAAISDCPSISDGLCKRLGYSESYGYFNAGVLTLNLQYWRDNNLSKKLLDFSLSHAANMCYMDQDALNSILHDKWIPFPDRFNFQVSRFWKTRWKAFSEEYRRLLPAECNDVRIVHFVGGGKPWNWRAYGGPFFTLWNKYRKKSLWKKDYSFRPYFKYAKHFIKRRLFLDYYVRQQSKWVMLPETRILFR